MKTLTFSEKCFIENSLLFILIFAVPSQFGLFCYFVEGFSILGSFMSGFAAMVATIIVAGSFDIFGAIERVLEKISRKV